MPTIGNVGLTLPGPRNNLAAAILRPVVAAGDFSGNGDGEDLFTLVAHGLSDGDRLYLIYESAAGVVTGSTRATYIVKRINDDDFQLTTDGSTVVENSADGTAVFLNITH